MGNRVSRVFILIVVICLFSTPAHAAGKAKKSKKAYANFLTTSNAIPDFPGEYAEAFALEDINDDGIPELCVFENEKEKSKKALYTYSDGEVQPIITGSKYVSFYGVPENELLIYSWSRKNKGEYDDIYLFDGEDLEKVISRQVNKSGVVTSCSDYRSGTELAITDAKFDVIYADLKDGKEPDELFTDVHSNIEGERKSVLGYKGSGSKVVNPTITPAPVVTPTPTQIPSGPEYDLSGFGYRTVIIPGNSGSLVFQKSPDGEFMNDYQYNTGDRIYVNIGYRQNGYALAYNNGVYGYVVARYIDWDSESGTDGRFNLSDFGYRTVVTNGKGTLVFQATPNGSFMYDYSYKDGESIYVNLYWRQNGYAIAYSGGTYGYVDAGYINWNNTSDTRYDLSDYGYRTVSTGGKGSLVFQSSPNGSFMYDHEFWSGDSIYVNLYWRQNGYAIAYENGTYGYVDASYINWSGGSGDKYDLSNYGYRAVKTKGGDDTLVFQTSPDGSFMYDYTYWNGDSIYVNLYWRSDGYAIAYKNGTYGYVDAKYINW